MKVSLTTAALIFLAGVADASDWPHLRGPNLDGRLSGTGLLEDGPVGLELAWRIPLGSGYSGIAATEKLAFTLFTSGSSDWIAAFDLRDGGQVWRRSLGPKNPGHDGSTDGPISSPVLGGDTVYLLSPTGEVLALALDTGEVRWRRTLKDEFEAEAPHFGFGTTPVLEGGILIVQAGGASGHSLVGLDSGTGETRWSSREDPVGYQSPTVMELAGRRQIVAVIHKAIGGFDPATGKALWSHRLAEGENTDSAHPAPAGKDRFIVFVSGEAVAFEVSKAEPGFQVKELYRSKALGGNYAPPVFHEGHLYGFRGHILTCMDAATGQRRWRSREPGGDGLLLIDGRLIIFAAHGNLVVAQASPEGYRELARHQALAGSGLTWPSFAGNRILVRNLEEMAAVTVGSKTRQSGEAIAQAALSASQDHSFGRWLRKAEKAENPVPLVEEFLRNHETFPLVEGPWVHFLYYGTAEDVAVSGSVIRTGGSMALHRLKGTDLFYRTIRLDPGGRWEYGLHIDFASRKTDPRNPRAVTAMGGWGTVSEVVTEGYELSTHPEKPQGARGRLEAFKLPSKHLGEEKEIQVWLPPGYGSDDLTATIYPLLVVNNATEWLEAGQLVNSLDNLTGKDLPPVVVAFVPKTRAWWIESGGSSTESYARMLAEELVPELRKRYTLSTEPSSTALLGTRYFALTSAFTALRYPEVFGKVALQSPNLALGARDTVHEMIRTRRGASISIYLDWDRFGELNLDRGLDTRSEAQELASLLDNHGYSWSGGEIFDSAGWGAWRNRSHRILSSLFPSP